MTRRCVLIHGFAGSPARWNAVVRGLPANWTVVRPTVSGHDPTREWPEAVRSFDDEVDRLAAALPSEGRSLLCGYSLGGRLALGLLGRFPKRFDAALVVGAHPGLAAGASSRRERLLSDERWARAIETDLEGFVEDWERLPLFESQRGLAPELLEQQRRARAAHRPEALARAMRVLSLGGMPDRRPALRTLEIPVLFVAGALDRKFSALAEEMGELAPLARTMIVPEVGHNVPLEAPRELALALRELASPCGGPAGE